MASLLKSQYLFLPGQSWTEPKIVWCACLLADGFRCVSEESRSKTERPSILFHTRFFAYPLLLSCLKSDDHRRFFQGPHHFLGGRFVPPGIATKYSLKLPAYPGTEQCVRLEEWGQQQNGSGEEKAGESS